MQSDQVDIVAAHNVPAPLLHAEIIVAVVLCEAPDYVKRSLTTWLRRGVHAALVFALLNIVRYFLVPTSGRHEETMDQLSKKGLSFSECVASYDLYAREVRCLAASTCEIQRRILRRLCSFCFGDGSVAWDAICFTDIVRFLTAEFERYPNRGTQRASLTSMRTILRYLAENNMVPKGWDEALPRTATKRHAHLPRQLSREQIRALFKASQGNRWIARRDRALLLLLLRLGLRCEEVLISSGRISTGKPAL